MPQRACTAPRHRLGCRISLAALNGVGAGLEDSPRLDGRLAGFFQADHNRFRARLAVVAESDPSLLAPEAVLPEPALRPVRSHLEVEPPRRRRSARALSAGHFAFLQAVSVNVGQQTRSWRPHVAVFSTLFPTFCRVCK